VGHRRDLSRELLQPEPSESLQRNVNQTIPQLEPHVQAGDFRKHDSKYTFRRTYSGVTLVFDLQYFGPGPTSLILPAETSKLYWRHYYREK
jgi:hypothetical protein